jgi:AraC-like DNA-binding protein
LPSEFITFRKIDPRIRQVISVLQDAPFEKIPIRQLSGKVSLSEGRLVHLFKEQMGLPVRKYRLWLKLNIAIESIINKSYLTDSAYNAGFSDSAHFSRTFSRMFGISPSKLIKNSQFVQVFNCSR